MKYNLLPALLVVVVLFSCKKEVALPTARDPIVDKIRLHLRTNLTTQEGFQPDFTNIIKSPIANSDSVLYRVGFKGQPLESYFVAIMATAGDHFVSSKVVHITGSINDYEYNGQITISELNGSAFRYSPIIRGQVKFSPLIKSASDLQVQYIVPDPYVELPEVIVVSSPRTRPGFSMLVTMLTFFGEGSGGGGGGYVSGGGGGSGGGASGGGASGSGGAGSLYPTSTNPFGGTNPRGPLIIDEPILIDFENQYNNPEIDVEKYMKCFSAIPDAGAKCEIEIFSDLPVDGDPTKLFDWRTGSPGHVFLKVSKSNTGQVATQYIGFYPKTGWKAGLTTGPVDAKVVDNSGHEWNASYKVDVTPEQFKTGVLRVITESKNAKYRIDHYNCTDWALQIFNATVSPSQHLSIPKYPLPGNSSQYPSNTPQGLFVKLKEMQTATGSTNPNISIPLVGFAGSCTGACN
ncbi:MAG: hypothetical protein ABWZ25_08860 [Chitinophagaceae bacterium]